MTQGWLHLQTDKLEIQININQIILVPRSQSGFQKRYFLQIEVDLDNHKTFQSLFNVSSYEPSYSGVTETVYIYTSCSGLVCDFYCMYSTILTFFCIVFVHTLNLPDNKKPWLVGFRNIFHWLWQLIFQISLGVWRECVVYAACFLGLDHSLVFCEIIVNFCVTLKEQLHK